MKKIILFLLLTAAALTAQQKRLERRYVPIIISGFQNTALEGLNIDQWSAYRYDAAASTWTATPLQFDERDSKDRYNRNDQDRQVDDNDELVMMPQDVGDKAHRFEWLSGSTDQERIELTFSDPTNLQDSGWVYLYPHPPGSFTYFEYGAAPADTPAADTVKTDAYHIGHNPEGWLDYISLATDFKTDLIDRLKVRLAGSNTGLGIAPYVLDENYIESGDTPVDFYPGSVRSFQKVTSKIDLSEFNIPSVGKVSSPYYFQYFPFSFSTSAQTEINNILLVIAGLKTIRQSLDFSPSAEGMTFYSTANPEGLTLDGRPDEFDSGMDTIDQYNWIMASGAPGSIVILFDLPDIRSGIQELYYQDDKAADTGKDGTPDTGDGESWGDMGTWIQATGDAIGISGKLELSFIGYFIPEPHQSVDFAEQLAAWQSHPVAMTATRQTYSSSIVAGPAVKPESNTLVSVYPNPCTMGERSHITLKTDFEQDRTVTIYNILGQRIRTWQVSDAPEITLHWDGRDDRQQYVTPGIYLIHVFTETTKITQKFAIVK